MNKKLINAVKKQLGDNDYLNDAANHGADSGFPGFTYYSDTVDFFKKNKADILEQVKEEAEQFDQNPINFVMSFNCLKNNVEESEVAQALYGRIGKDGVTIPNALAWFALEEVARFVIDQE
jgi:hypothetical protein